MVAVIFEVLRKRYRLTHFVFDIEVSYTAAASTVIGTQHDLSSL